MANSEDESDTDDSLNEQPKVLAPTNEHLLLWLRESNLNWFEFVAKLKLLMRISSNNITEQILFDFSEKLGAFDFNDVERETIEISRQAYLNDERIMASNATSLTDSESDDPEDWLDLNLRSARGKEMVKKHVGIV